MQITLKVENLSVKLTEPPRQVLDSICGHVKPGQILGKFLQTNIIYSFCRIEYACVSGETAATKINGDALACKSEERLHCQYTFSNKKPCSCEGCPDDDGKIAMH